MLFSLALMLLAGIIAGALFPAGHAALTERAAILHYRFSA